MDYENLSDYALAKALGINRQAVAQWEGLDKSSPQTMAKYIRDRALLAREQGARLTALSSLLEETAVYYEGAESPVPTVEDLAKRLNRKAQKVHYWDIPMTRDAVVAKCRELSAYHKEQGQEAVDRAARYIAFARELEEHEQGT